MLESILEVLKTSWISSWKSWNVFAFHLENLEKVLEIIMKIIKIVEIYIRNLKNGEIHRESPKISGILSWKSCKVVEIRLGNLATFLLFLLELLENCWSLSGKSSKKLLKFIQESSKSFCVLSWKSLKSVIFHLGNLKKL